MFKVLVLLLVCMTACYAFRSNRLMSSNTMRSLSLKAAESDGAEPDFEPDADASLFNMNRRVRLGRSKDQDGKSNIWSIEPAMEVEEEEEGASGKKNIFIGAAVIATAIAALPLFNAFSGLFPDPSDF